MQVDGFDKIWPIADEDLERESAEKTSSVHFMRWELTAEMAQAVKDGANIKAGIDHDAYNYTVDVPANMRDSLAEDLD
jgi:ABC-type sugar transport system substrate-binding protein